MWRQKLQWDEALPVSILHTWKTLAAELDDATNHSIPRPCCIPEADQHTLHVFCDASQTAYAAVAYLSSSSGSATESHLILSRSKLAPLKPSPKLTIPKLELMAAALGADLIAFLKKQLPINLDHIILWSDSTCVLGWINSRKDLPSFVQRRVTRIRKSEAEYRYVPSRDNPADLPSRGTSSHLSEESIWWHGPEWLQNPLVPEPEQPNTEESRSPSKKKGGSPPSVSLHPLKKKGCSDPIEAVSLVVGEDPSEPFDLSASDFSTMGRLVRVTAWAQRFIRNCRKSATKKLKDQLTVPELCSARNLWLQSSQRNHCTDVVSAIREQRKNNTVQSLRLYIDDRGLIRSRGRLEHANLPPSSKFPIFLPHNSAVTRLLDEEHHRILMHPGVSHALASIREKYWIPKGRSTVKTILKKCITCRRAEGGPFDMPAMAPLPPERVNVAEAFLYTGVDYFGPLFAKTAEASVKVWVALFTCLSTRAVHLELVTDISSEQFLLAFRRFVSRRGVPRAMWSDNAPQFKMTKTTLDKAWKEVISDPAVADTITARGTDWHFSVQHAPWMGGIYERMVGLVKRALRKTVRSAHLTPDQLRTFLTEAEAAVNSRPLVYVGGDTPMASTDVITPSYFLSLKPNLMFPELIDEQNIYPDFLCRLSSASFCYRGGRKAKPSSRTSGQLGNGTTC